MAESDLIIAAGFIVFVMAVAYLVTRNMDND